MAEQSTSLYAPDLMFVPLYDSCIYNTPSFYLSNAFAFQDTDIDLFIFLSHSTAIEIV